MLFLIPVAATAAEVVAATAIVGGTALVLHNAGRHKGQAESAATLATEIRAMHARLDEMKAGR